jgi:hypothetical protein
VTGRRRLAGASLLALALALLPARAALAHHVRTSVFEFRPTQMEVGRAAIEYRVMLWRAEARKKGMSFQDYARTELLPKYGELKVPAVIDPNGHIRNTDAHHRIGALREVARETGLPFEVTAKVLADYRGWTFEDYAEDFINRLHKGQFTEEVEKLSPVERMRHLPETYEGMLNNPLRSTVEVVFTQHDIEGSTMHDYVEFRTGRRMLRQGLMHELRTLQIALPEAKELAPELATDVRVVRVVERRLAAKPMRRYLLSEAVNKPLRRELHKGLKRMAKAVRRMR